MPIVSTADLQTLDLPSLRYRNLVYADISDTVDLAETAKAIRVYNGSGSNVTIKCTAKFDATASFPTLFTVAAGTSEILPISVRRIFLSGSTNLTSGGSIVAGVEVQLFLE